MLKFKTDALGVLRNDVRPLLAFCASSQIGCYGNYSTGVGEAVEEFLRKTKKYRENAGFFHRGVVEKPVENVDKSLLFPQLKRGFPQIMSTKGKLELTKAVLKMEKRGEPAPLRVCVDGRFRRLRRGRGL